jgi:hypothetical protein
MKQLNGFMCEGYIFCEGELRIMEHAFWLLDTCVLYICMYVYIYIYIYIHILCMNMKVESPCTGRACSRRKIGKQKLPWPAS